MPRLYSVLARWSRAALIAGFLFVAGCTSVPQASPERDAEAKLFNTQPGAATIYVYRPDFSNAVGDGNYSVLWVDDRLIGETLPGSFFRLDLRPGRHVLSGQVADVGRFALETRAGELYFVALRVLGDTSHFALVPPEAGKRDIRGCCAMMENWAPGQRPLLR